MSITNISSLPWRIDYDFRRRVTSDTCLPFATAHGGSIVEFDAEASEHLLVVGPASKGKRTLVRAVLYSAALRNWSIYVIDPLSKPGSYDFLGDHLTAQAPSRPETFDVMNAVGDESARRRALIVEADVASYAEVPSENLPPIMVLVEDFSLLESPSPEFAAFIDTMNAITSSANFTGIHLMLMLNEVTMGIVDKIPIVDPMSEAPSARVLMGSPSSSQVGSVLRTETTPRMDTPAPRGRGFWEPEYGNVKIIQVWFGEDRYGIELASRTREVERTI